MLPGPHSPPCGIYLLAPLAQNKKGGTPDKAYANILYTPLGNTPLHSTLVGLATAVIPVEYCQELQQFNECKESDLG